MKKCMDIMTKNPKWLSPLDTLRQGAIQMRDEDIGSILICEPDTGKLLGIVTDRDIAIKNVAEGLSPENTLETIGTWNPTCCHEDDDVNKAMSFMTEHQVRRLPVVDKNGRVVGIISQGDIATRVQEPKKTAEVVREVSELPSAQYKQEHKQEHAA